MSNSDPQNDSKAYQFTYRAWLLRCWAEQVGGEWRWRYSLESSGKPRIGFASLEQLSQFLESQNFIDKK